MTESPLIRFREAQYVNFYHDLRVFICGVDCSADLRDRVAVSISDSTAPNTATITLDNALDKYTFTDDNAAGNFGEDQWSRYSEKPKADIVARKLGKDGKVTIRDLDKTVADTFNNLIVGLGKNGAVVTTVSEPDPNDPNKQITRNVLTGETIKGAQASFTDVNKAVINDSVDKLVQKLGPAFFNDKKTTDDTRQSIMTAVVDQFGSYASLDPVEVQQQVDASILRRNGAIFQAAQQDTANHTPINVEAGNTNPKHPETGRLKESFDPGDLVIGKHDPICIFAHNPLSEADEWYPIFTGFINTVNERTDEVTGESSISVNCYCIRAIMRKMRIAENAAIAQFKPDLVFQKIGFFSDTLGANASAFTSAFTGLSLEEEVCQLVTGTIDRKLKPDQASGDRTNVNPISGNASINAVGKFSIGDVLRYDGTASTGTPASTGSTKTLEEWHTLTVFGPGRTFMTEAEMVAIGSDSYIGGPFDPWSRNIHFLLPANGTNVQTLNTIVIEDNLKQFQFTTRWETIQKAAQLLDYQFMTSPNGDLLLEFPVYDFVPEDFGPTWSSLFKYFGHLIDSNVTPESEEVPAGVVMTGAIDPTGKDNPADELLLRVMAYSKTVAAKYGVTGVEYQTKPFLHDQERLKAYAAIAYQKMIANASSLSFTACHRPFLMPNRPILHDRRGRLGVSYAVEHTWEIGGVVSTEVAVRCIRKRTIEGNTIAYRFITGGTNMAISYRVPNQSVDLTDTVPTKEASKKPVSKSAQKKSDDLKAKQDAEKPTEEQTVVGYISGKQIELQVGSIGDGKYLRTDASVQFKKMRDAANAANITLHVNTAFRTNEQQADLFQKFLDGKGSKAAKPGFSNHQGGISVDISTGGQGYKSPIYEWLNAHAVEYGFTNDVSGEPWHWTFTNASVAQTASQEADPDVSTSSESKTATAADNTTKQAKSVTLSSEATTGITVMDASGGPGNTSDATPGTAPDSKSSGS